MDKDIHRKFENILGSHGLLMAPQDLSPYCRDASGITTSPTAVLFPETVAQIAQIVRLAYDERLSVSIRGGGTGLDGGAVATRGGLLLSLVRMNRIIEVSSEDMVAVVQAGLNAELLNLQLRSFGLFYPVGPASQALSTLGGDVATRAHSLWAAKYGPIGQHLLGLTAVVSPGEVIRCGARTLKCATGYHLTDLFIGSRGRLGIIAEIIIKLVPRPQVRASLVATLEGIRQASDFQKALTKAGILVSRAELMAPPIHSLGFGHLIPPAEREKFLLLVELDGPESLVRQDLIAASDLLRAAGAAIFLQTDDEKQSEGWWRARSHILSLLSAPGEPAVLMSVVVPSPDIDSFLLQTQRICQEALSALSFFGHLGENRWHLVLRPLQGQDDGQKRLLTAAGEIHKISVSLGGQFLRPYALGLSSRGFPSSPQGSGQGRLWRALKVRFDPLDIFNPVE